jgi:hypothetical protein
MDVGQAGRNLQTVDEVVVSPADTMLGQLQRGRGAGYLAALESQDHEAQRALKECIAHDPRWDHQVESRADYYAELALEVKLDLDWLGDYAQQHWYSRNDRDDDAVWLAAPVLGCMAVLGEGQALAPLLAIVHQTPVDRMHEAIWQLLDCEANPISPELPAILNARLSDDELQATMRDLGWFMAGRQPPTWIQQDDRLMDALSKVRGTAPLTTTAPKRRTLQEALASRTPATQLTHYSSSEDREALRRTVVEGEPGPRMKALQILAMLGDPSAPGLVEDSIGSPDNQARICGRRALQHLHGPEALSAARRWLGLGHESELAYRAIEVVGNNGGPQDIGAVRDLARKFTEEGAMYPMCTAAEALAKLRDSEAIPWFREIFAQTSYSSLRKRCAVALAELDSDFQSSLAVECLWDCEPEARTSGAQMVDSADPGVLARLQKLSTRRCEDGEVKAAAMTRLEVAPGSASSRQV